MPDLECSLLARTAPRTLALAMLLCSCGKPSDRSETSTKGSTEHSAGKPTPAVPANPADAGEAPSRGPRCTAQPFAASVDLAEASGATLLPDGSIMVIGDSGTNGAFVRLDANTGALLSQGQLDLDGGASDDLEGLSRIGDTLYAITSSGRMRHFQITAEGFVASVKSYALADKRSAALVCASAKDSNCGPNYEGLCLRNDASFDESCAGFAAAKTTGKLVCLRLEKNGRLRLDASHTIEVAKAQSLSGCDFDTQDRLWFGTNFFATNTIGFVEDWNDVEKLKITGLGSVGIGFGEAIALGDADQVYRFSDTAGSPSLLSKYICR